LKAGIHYIHPSLHTLAEEIEDMGKNEARGLDEQRNIMPSSA
jgi:hypothetical protein